MDALTLTKKLIFELSALGMALNTHLCLTFEIERNRPHEGICAECYAKGIPLQFFFTTALRFKFTGIGIYPWWKHPGLWLDLRPGERKIWVSMRRGHTLYMPKGFKWDDD